MSQSRHNRAIKQNYLSIFAQIRQRHNIAVHKHNFIAKKWTWKRIGMDDGQGFAEKFIIFGKLEFTASWKHHCQMQNDAYK